MSRIRTSAVSKVRKLYEASAEDYDRMMDGEIGLPIYRELLGQLHRNISGLSGLLLDTACGSGHMLELYHKAFGPERSLAAVLNFFAIHHVDREDLQACLNEWQRVLSPGGHLLLAAWEGSGPIDYGEAADIVALRYTSEELSDLLTKAGFSIVSCKIEPIEGFSMDALYLEAEKTKYHA